MPRCVLDKARTQRRYLLGINPSPPVVTRDAPIHMRQEGGESHPVVVLVLFQIGECKDGEAHNGISGFLGRQEVREDFIS